MQLAEVVIGSGFCEDVLPRTIRIEAFGIERFVARGYRVRFVVVVDERDSIAHMAVRAGGLYLKSLMWIVATAGSSAGTAALAPAVRMTVNSAT
jgi:hypothetical protein